MLWEISNKLQILCIFFLHFNHLLGSETVVNHLQTLFGIMFHLNQPATMLIWFVHPDVNVWNPVYLMWSSRNKLASLQLPLNKPFRRNLWISNIHIKHGKKRKFHFGFVSVKLRQQFWGLRCVWNFVSRCRPQEPQEKLFFFFIGVISIVNVKTRKSIFSWDRVRMAGSQSLRSLRMHVLVSWDWPFQLYLSHIREQCTAWRPVKPTKRSSIMEALWEAPVIHSLWFYLMLKIELTRLSS